jgi:hypothetical protein
MVRAATRELWRGAARGQGPRCPRAAARALSHLFLPQSLSFARAMSPHCWRSAWRPRWGGGERGEGGPDGAALHARPPLSLFLLPLPPQAVAGLPKAKDLAVEQVREGVESAGGALRGRRAPRAPARARAPSDVVVGVGAPPPSNRRAQRRRR